MIDAPDRVLPLPPAPMAETGEGPHDASFRENLLRSLARVALLQEETERAADEIVRGPGGEVGDLLAAVRKAKEAFDTLMQVRHRILTAYEEIQKAPV